MKRSKFYIVSILLTCLAMFSVPASAACSTDYYNSNAGHLCVANLANTNEVTSGVNTVDIANLTGNVGGLSTQVGQNQQDITGLSNQMSGYVSYGDRIGALENAPAPDVYDSTNLEAIAAQSLQASKLSTEKYTWLKSEVDRIQRKSDYGTAMALASAQLPQATDYSKGGTLVAGAGVYNSRGALALGWSNVYEISEMATVVKASFSLAGGELAAGVGASLQL